MKVRTIGQRCNHGSEDQSREQQKRHDIRKFSFPEEIEDKNRDHCPKDKGTPAPQYGVDTDATDGCEENSCPRSRIKTRLCHRIIYDQKEPHDNQFRKLIEVGGSMCRFPTQAIGLRPELTPPAGGFHIGPEPYRANRDKCPGQYSQAMAGYFIHHRWHMCCGLCTQSRVYTHVDS